MDEQVKNISQRLSLRYPQHESLELLQDIAAILGFGEDDEVPDDPLAAIREKFPEIESFERAFPSLCFSLATGVGKTRLMGAFIAYLHQNYGLKHFFVLAPNLTIYEKLISDFTPGTAKYVFQGLAAFATEAPVIIHGDNYEDFRGYDGDIFGGILVGVFNISKLNRDAKDVTRGKDKGAARIRRLREELGGSFFEYLKKLPDLILLMDESHRYRADAGVAALNELNPRLGLELTATPYVETGKGAIGFKNIIYNYSLPDAIEDGFVKEPAVVTQRDFNPKSFDKSNLEVVKLEDGVRVHEEVKAELQTYAIQTGNALVKPFILVIARDTTHAAELLSTVEGDQFFKGRYKGKALQVDSSQKGTAAEDEMVKALLSVESTDNPIEIVIHVNMLKEGWDVTNLYTIVPLRAANARVLIEQSIGRGLRLPYGKKTGVEAVDTLNIIAHDKFQEIIDEAEKPGGALRKIKKRELEKPSGYKKPVSVVVKPHIDTQFELLSKKDKASPGAKPSKVESKGESVLAKTALEAFRRKEALRSSRELTTSKVMEEVTKEVTERHPEAAQKELGIEGKVDVAEIVKKVAETIVAGNIDIPRISIEPVGEVYGSYNSFTVDCSGFNQEHMENEIVVHNLKTRKQRTLNRDPGYKAKRLEDHIVTELLNYDEVDYDRNADVLYELAGQVVAHLVERHGDEDKARAILRQFHRVISHLLFAQMQEHYDDGDTKYEARVSKGWMAIRETAYNAESGKEAVDYRLPVEKKSEIRRMVFAGFEKCLYPRQKFDSDTERRLAMIFEDSDDVKKWFKPGRKQFNITYRHKGSEHPNYEPDFVAELTDKKLLLETKWEKGANDDLVNAKRDAAVEWCKNASEYEVANGGKPWQYILIPHSEVLTNATVDGLIQKFGCNG